MSELKKQFREKNEKRALAFIAKHGLDFTTLSADGHVRIFGEGTTVDFWITTLSWRTMGGGDAGRGLESLGDCLGIEKHGDAREKRIA